MLKEKSNDRLIFGSKRKEGVLIQEGVQEYTNQSPYLILSDLSVYNWDDSTCEYYFWKRVLEERVGNCMKVHEDKKGSCEFMYGFDEASVY